MRKRRSAFTLVEVMVSLGVMTIGSMAIIGMQRQTTLANTRARELATAMQIAQTWIERLKADGTRWNAVGNSTVDLAATDFLGVNAGNGTPGGLFTTLVPMNGAGFPVGMSNGFDFYGDDEDIATNGMVNVRYCASYRVGWVYRDTTSNPPSQDRALRADVRVWWPDESAPTPTNAATMVANHNNCTDDGIDLSPPVGGGTTNYLNYHIVYLSTVIRPN